jgi:quinol monooxygenase YgiN
MRAVLLLCFLAATLPAATQAAPAPPSTIYVIDYVDVLANTASRAAAVLRHYRDASRGESGAVGIELYSQTGRSIGFALLEAWRDAAAFEAHAKAAAMADLRRDLKPIQLAPPDVRVHTGYSLGAGAADRQNAVTLLVHVDVPPGFLPDYEQMAIPYVEASRRETGLLRLDLLQAMPPHTNHFTVIETWIDARALQMHQRASIAQSYREELAPKLGALYDERAYMKIK